MKPLLLVLCTILSAATPDSASVTAAFKKTAQWQMNAFGVPSGVHCGWENAPFFMGLMAGYRETGDTSYLNYAKAWAVAANWTPLQGTSTSNADDEACTQVYAEIFMLNPADSNRTMINPMITNFDYVKRTNALGRQLWWWADALFMAPPALARLGHIRNDLTDFSWLQTMYFDVVDHLLDPATGLLYRDANFIYPAMVSPNGRKIFWSRGDGWVFSGLARLIPYLPATDTAMQQSYIDLFRTMADALVMRQLPTGLWSASLDDPASYPGPETSGSSFFCHGLAWGVNNGVLPYAPYAAAAIRAWNGLLNCVDSTGKLGYVQGVGDRPATAYSSGSAPFGTGAFLLAAAEMANLRLIPDSTTPLPAANLAATVSDDTIFLSWDAGEDPETGISGYEIHRGLRPDSLRFLRFNFGGVALDTVIGQDMNVYYAVRAINGNGLLGAQLSPACSLLLPLYPACDLRAGTDTIQGLSSTHVKAFVTLQTGVVDSVGAAVRYYGLDTAIALVSLDGRVQARDTAGTVRIVAKRGLSWLNDTCRVTVVRTSIAFLKRFNFRCSAAAWRYGWVSTDSTPYDSVRGYGWTGCATGMETRCNRAGGDLLGTFVLTRGSTCSTGVFRVAAPDGEYIVRTALGDASYPNESLWVFYGSYTVARHYGAGTLGNSYSILDDTVTVSGGTGARFRVYGKPNGKISYLILLSKQGVAMSEVSDDGYPGPLDALPVPADPEAFALELTPNPFNPSVTIRLNGALPGAKVCVFDLSGRRVAAFTPGEREMVWNASGRPSGTYIVRAEAGRRKLVKRAVLIR